MKKILIVTAVYERHDLTEIVLNHYRNIKNNGWHDIQLLAVGSEGDKSRDLCILNGWDYIEHPNTPISQKFHHLFLHTQTYVFDFIILVGSDDLMSEEVITFYETKIDRDTPYLFGLRDIYFYSIPHDATLHMEGYPFPQTIGAGRVFSRTLMERINYSIFTGTHINRGLDTSCSNRLKRAGIKEVAVTMKETGGLIIDIKHPLTSLTPFSRIDRWSRRIDIDVLSLTFPHLSDSIRSLKNKYENDFSINI